MARGSATGFPLTGNEFDGGRGLTKGSTHGDVLGLIALLTNLEAWIKVRGVVDAPGDLPTTGMEDGDIYAVKESAGAASPPAMYIYNEDTTTWVNITSTGLPANHATTHLNGGADAMIKAPTVPGAYPYTVLATDEVVLGTSGAAPVAVNLPTAVGISGRRYIVTKIDAGVGTVDVTPDGAETINGVGAIYSLLLQWDTIILESDGVGWFTVAAFPSAFHRVRHLPGGVDELIVAPTAPAGYPYVVLATDEVILGTSGAAPVVVTLPSAAGISGKRFVVKKIDAGVGTVDVTPDPAESIEGLGVGVAYVLANQWDTVTVESDGTNWVIVGAVPRSHHSTHENGGADELLPPPTVPGAYPYTTLATDRTVRITSGGGGVVVNLYAAAAADVGRRHTFIKIDAGAGAAAITPNGAETINGVAAAVNLAAQWDSITLECVAVGEWEIVAVTP